MVWFWFSVISILILAVLAFFWAARIRKQRLEQKLRLEITNQGNVESHFQLRVEELTGQLEFRYTCAGSRLPEVFEMDPAGQVAGRQPPAAQPAPAGSGVQGISEGSKCVESEFYCRQHTHINRFDFTAQPRNSLFTGRQPALPGTGAGHPGPASLQSGGFTGPWNRGTIHRRLLQSPRILLSQLRCMDSPGSKLPRSHQDSS